MTPFEFITVALSFILGLGITQVLLSAIGVFRARDRIAINWMALAWAAIILLWQLQYWWAVLELDGLIHTWTLLQFVVLVAYTLMLFVAGALILPSPDHGVDERLHGAFQRDGRWAPGAWFWRCCHCGSCGPATMACARRSSFSNSRPASGWPLASCHRPATDIAANHESMPPSTTMHHRANSNF